MCGVAGIWNLDGRSLEAGTLKRFTDSMAHRGPDGAGYELLEKNSLGFGHRRLSILDVSEAGKQPMYNKQKDLVITFNGEIYNFLEIRNELKAKGEQFSTETDTEVILSAYKMWGKAALNKFNGMFAIAIWDSRNEELFIARDRFGVKPLYYLHIPGSIFAFASETYAFKHLSNFSREVDPLTFNISLHDPSLIEGTDRTIFKNISQLRPGHHLTFKNTSGIKIEQWWNTKNNLIKITGSYNDQVNEFRNLFEDACKLRMRSDVSLASALSGGLDSSSVYCTLHKLKQESPLLERTPTNWQKAFVATFPGTSVDERHYAEKVVRHVKGDAVYIVPQRKELVEDIIKSTRLFDGITQTPINSISDVYKSMKEHGITVSMDGHGVDEMMYGYNSYVLEAFYNAIAGKQIDKAHEYARILAGLSPLYKYEELVKTIKKFDKNLVKRGIGFITRRLGREKEISKPVAGQNWFESMDDRLILEIRALNGYGNGMSASEKAMYDDFHMKSLPINLRDFDRASMQHGIEIRMPFMDYRLVSYVFSLPQDAKLGGGFTKRILRDAMKGTLPEEIRTRTLKIGIGAPMQEWFQGELKQYINDTIHSSSFYDSPYWNGKAIQQDLQSAYKNDSLSKNFCNRAWGILNAHIILNG
jgi:asparagine synthase (glutamine-hydrolysing)